MKSDRLRILLADGNPAIRSALSLLLETRLKVRIIGEADSMEALLAGLAVSRPDILILDWELPGSPKEDRFKLLRSVHPPLKVLVTSSRPESVAQALAAGADSCVSKSEPPEQVIQAIQAL